MFGREKKGLEGGEYIIFITNCIQGLYIAITPDKIIFFYIDISY